MQRQGALAVRGRIETLDISVINDVLPLRPEDVEAEARAVQRRLEHRRASAAARQALKSGPHSSHAQAAAAAAAADIQGQHIDHYDHRPADDRGHVVRDATDWHWHTALGDHSGEMPLRA